MRTTPLWAHRGFSGRYPENTMLSFVAALEVGADGLELDVHQTADGHFVVMHDLTVDRTTNGHGVISEMTLAEIAALDGGSFFNSAFQGTPVPKLQDVLKLVAISRPITLNIEWKMDLARARNLDEVFDMIGDLGLRRVIHSSFHDANLAILAKRYNQVKTALLLEAGVQDGIGRAKKLGAIAIHPDHVDITPLYVRRAHKELLLVHPYTVDHPNAFSWMEECGVDAVITNWPGESWLGPENGGLYLGKSR